MSAPRSTGSGLNREAILQALGSLSEQLGKLGESLRNVDPKPIMTASEGFSAVDVKSAVEEAKALFAYDKLQNHPAKPSTSYLLEGVALVSQHRQRAALAK